MQVYEIELEMQIEALKEARKIAEEATAIAKRSQENYAELFDFAPMAYFSLGEDGVIEKTNYQGAKLWGIERSKVVGRDFIQCVFREDIPQFNRFVEEVFRSENKCSCEIRLQISGRLIFVALEAVADKTRKACLMAVSDISERKQNESHLLENNAFSTSIFNALTSQIAVLDTQGVIVSVNNAWIRIWQGKCPAGILS